MRQIHFRAENQIVEIARGNLKARNRIRQRGQNGMSAGVPGGRFIQHRAPARQAAALRFQIAGFVGNVVHQPHERIERAKRVPLWLAQAEKCQIKAAVRLARDAIALGVGRANSCALGAGAHADRLRDAIAAFCAMLAARRVAPSVAAKSCEAKRAAEQPQLCPFRQRGTMLQRVVARRFDRIQNREAPAAEQLDIDAQGSINSREPAERPPRKALACAQSATSSGRRSAHRNRRATISSSVNPCSPNACPAEYRFAPSRGRAKHPARNSRAAKPCRCNPKTAAAPHRDNRKDKEPAGPLDSPNRRNNRAHRPRSRSDARAGPAGKRAANR